MTGQQRSTITAIAQRQRVSLVGRVSAVVNVIAKKQAPIAFVGKRTALRWIGRQ
jgi:hypothetical protein